ncbi:hypothetical protein R9C00_03835 [Flammeovirgaceae bacterium SG7u.111]|nr:hypothetical protein [Flammeovirgaceae bacterium SG7u.132]WPO36576.1 hypothetical protein R9C00_03835 [Flammeovirgaceae bacterium SG7u.111]
MKQKLLFLLLLLASTSAFAQLDNQLFNYKFPVDSGRSEELHVELNSFGYFKNNEFFNQIIEGYTLFGYQFNPRLSYQPSPHVYLSVGAFFQKDFGNDDFTQIQPTFTFKYQKNNFALIFGNLEGALHHGLIEPLFDFENVIDNRLENGLQFLFDKPRWSMDLWVDWQKMIYENSPFQEEIGGGLNFHYHLLSNEGLKLDAELQYTAFHRGGQINQPGFPILTVSNLAPGLSFEKEMNGSFVEKIGASAYYTLYSNDADSSAGFAYESGSGIYLNASANSRIFDIMLSYWLGDSYQSVMGGPLYQSQSFRPEEPNYTEQQRSLLFIRLMKNIHLGEGTDISIRLQPYLDLENDLFEHYMEFYLHSNLDFFIAKLKRR